MQENFMNIRYTVAETFNAQLEEYTTSVDSNTNYGLDERLAKQIKELHTQIDGIMEEIDKVKKEAGEFYKSYNENLDNKK